MKAKLDPNKVCGVCGDKALGYNFNAVTCESCKAFFRRNALLKKQFKCPFSSNCEINTVTRRFCQKCRLDKCFAIGMCKDLIMSEEDKTLKRQKIEENRARKRGRMHGFKTFKKIKKEDKVDSDSQDNFGCIEAEDPKDVYQPNGAQINYDLVSSSDDVSMIRTMLNTTPNDNLQKNGEDGNLITLINNNEVNCRSKEATSSVQNTRGTLDVTKDVVEDVHR